MSLFNKFAFVSSVLASSILATAASAEASTKLFCTLSADGVEVDAPKLLNVNQQSWAGALDDLRKGAEVTLVDSNQALGKMRKIKVGAYLSRSKDNTATLRLEELTSDGGRTESVLSYLSVDLGDLQAALGKGVRVAAKLPREQEVVSGDGVYLWVDVHCTTEGSAQ